MKNWFCLPLAVLLALGCSSQSVKKTTAMETPLPKARPATQQDQIYSTPVAAPPSITGSPIGESPAPEEVQRQSCETPLGTIPDGGTATGYLSPEAAPGEVCISDTISCSDGIWTGQAIHPNCKVRK